MSTRTFQTSIGVSLLVLAASASARSNASLPPPNDDCANAIAIGDGTVSGTTIGATISTNGCGFSGLTPDVWYAYTAVRTGMLAISTCGSSYDTVISAYSACNATVELACNDDAPPGAPCGFGSNDSYATLSIQGGSTYWIRVSGYVASTGNFVLTTQGDTGHPYCLGDGVSGAICPCGNVSHANDLAGCKNSLGLPGKLSAAGVPDVSADSVVLQVSGAPAGSSCLFFQGTTQTNNGYGSSFGDGLRCAGGSVIRLWTKTASNGVATFPELGEPSVSARGFVPASGGRRLYQAWYRNAVTFCTIATFNLTNGFQVSWQP